MSKLLRRLVIVAAVAALNPDSGAFAGITNIVNVGSVGFTFTPSQITNHVGDTIKFVPFSFTHTVSPNGAASEAFCGTSTLTNTCFVTFNTAGTFPFKCIPHELFGMVGVVVVLPAAAAPLTIAITNPTDGKIFPGPTNFLVRASTAGGQGVVTQVQFFADSTLLGTSTASPFSTVANGLAAGTYALTARAMDNAGSRATSGVVTVTIDDPPFVTILSPTNNAVLASTLPATLRASAGDNDGSISRVQFFANANLLGTSTSSVSPFILVVSNLGSGNFTLTARAEDNRGAATVSAGVDVSIITPGVIRFNTDLGFSGDFFPLTLSVTPGLNYVMEGSGNLSNWTALAAFTATNNFFTLSNPAPGGFPQRYYRAHLSPNP